MTITARQAALMPLVLGALTAFAPLSIDMYLPGLPQIQRELATTASATQLTLAAYFAGMGVGQLAYGPLADRFGRRPPLFAGVALYVLASLGCALAPDVRWLIALRFVQALGGSAGAVIPRAIVRDLYRGSDAAKLLSALMLVMGLAPILAPLLGGWLLGYGWRAIFYVLAAFGVLCAVVTATLLPETSAPDPSATDLRVLRGRAKSIVSDKRFVTASLAGAFGSAGMFAYIAASPFVFIELHHFAPRSYALLFGANASGLIFASQINRRLLARLTPSTVMVRASFVQLVAAVSLAALAVFGVGGALGIAACLFVFVAMIGFVSPNAAAVAMENHGSRAGLASAIMGSGQFAVAALSSSLVGVFNDGTARPMALVMAVCGCAGFALSFAAREGTTEGTSS